MVYVHLNWLNWFQFLIPGGVGLIIPIGFMIFLSPFVDVTEVSKAIVSFLTQLGPGTLCLLNVFVYAFHLFLLLFLVTPYLTYSILMPVTPFLIKVKNDQGNLNLSFSCF